MNVSMADKNRSLDHKKNIKLEQLLKELEALLGPVEKKIMESFSAPDLPVVFVVGGPRCGSTLVMQLLAETNCFAYPTNLLSRFYSAPYIGAKIQLLLAHTDYNFKNEILDFSGPRDFSSELGKTRGALSPNEFWYFWRRFIPNVEPVYLDEDQLKQINTKDLCSELAALQSVFNLPFALKAHILEQNLSFLDSLFEKVVFIHIKRDPFFRIQSILESRKKYFGDISQWYSVKPKEYSDLIHLDPISQVAGQVYFGDKGIERELAFVHKDRKCVFSYEDLCDNPERLFLKLRERLKRQEYVVNSRYIGPSSFHNSNVLRVSKKEQHEIIKAYRHFSGTDLLD